MPQPWTPLSGELGSSSTSGLIAGCGGNRGRGWGPLRGDSGATLKARLGELQLLMFHGVTPMRGEAGQSPGSLSAQAS